MKEIRKKLFGDHDPYKDLTVLPLDDQGWNSDSLVFDKVIEELKPKVIIEVGTWKGRSAINMAKICLEHYNDFEIVCVDTFLGSVEHWTGVDSHLPKSSLINGRAPIYNQFLSNIVHNNLQDYITPFPIDSTNGKFTLAKLDVSADLVYIDAGHEYYSVVSDLYHYSSIVRVGGCVLGDDFFYDPVKKAAYDVYDEDKVIELSRDKFLWIK